MRCWLVEISVLQTCEAHSGRPHTGVVVYGLTHAQGESKHLEETISTLKLAQRMMRVQNHVATIVESDPAILLRKYEKQIKELKHELVMHDALVERTGVVYEEHTPEQKHQLLQVIRHYVDAPTPEKEDEVLRLNSIHEIRELFRQFKLLLKAAESDALGHASASVRAGSAGSSASRTQSSNGSRADIHSTSSGNNNSTELGADAASAHYDDFVGDDEPGAVGFGLGIVSGAARPSTMDTVKKPRDAKASSALGSPTGGAAHNDSRTRHRSPSPARSVLDASIDERSGRVLDDPSASGDDSDDHDAHAMRRKNDAFAFYKTGPGKKLQRSLHDEKDKLADAKHKVKQLSQRVNAVKTQIDKVKAQLEDKRTHRSGSSSASPTSAKKSAGGGPQSKAPSSPSSHASQQQQRDEIVDEEEFLLMTAEREAKRDYRSLFDDLKAAKAELEFTHRSVELLRMRLVREFEDWYDDEGHGLALAKDDGDASPGRGRARSGYDSSHAFAFSKDDKLDDGEKFDQMEVERIRAQDPDSLAFFQAQKKMRQQAGATASQAKQARKPKRA